MAGEAERLPALQGQDPLGGPVSEEQVGKAAVVHELPVFSEWQLVAAAEVNDLADIEIRQSVVELWTQARNSISAERVRVGAIQQIAAIGHGLRPGICEQEGKALRSLLLKGGLQAVIRAYAHV